MLITVDGTEINLAPEYDEYLELMCAAVVKPGDPPIASKAEMVKRVLLDNYAANIQQHAAVRPKKVAERIKAIEAQAVATFQAAVDGVVG